MLIVKSTARVRAQVRRWRQADQKITLVPTMGGLHRAHLDLARLAGRRGRVIVSVFVNPAQFTPREDFERYPRDLDADAALLRGAGVDLLFAPADEEVYPRGLEDLTRVEVGGLSAELCGAYRPTHFAGVTSVVARLLLMVQPQAVVFGQKDYQQLVILRRMVEDLHFPVEVIEGPITREDDGLAMSSRNRYLTGDERQLAPVLHATLRECAEQIQQGERNFGELERAAMARLAEAGFSPDYVAVRRAGDLGPPAAEAHGKWVVLAAVWLGSARLIDNVICTVES